MFQNKFFQGTLGLLALTLVIFIGLKARNAAEEYYFIGKTVRDRDVITIDGTGKITATPDVAIINLGVQTEALTVKETQKNNTQKMNAIVAAMKKLGIADKDLQTSNYTLNPKIDWRDGKQNIIGYTIYQNLTVKLRDLDKAGEVLSTSAELGMNQSGGIQFTIDEPKTLQERARTMAIEDARKKADQLAKELGLRIVKVVTFSEGVNGNTLPPIPVYAKAQMADSFERAVQNPEIQSGSLDVVSHVNITFEVR
ncbi:SIMPL domain-containing protein [Candidatus Uhrbacteria bacterium]|nr:SIMPL domain-containing protein [Candidatus Uhrbacteria bacterium]